MVRTLTILPTVVVFSNDDCSEKMPRRIREGARIRSSKFRNAGKEQLSGPIKSLDSSVSILMELVRTHPSEGYGMELSS
jgi:formiminotetrahydrofolate cyclodeaminase